MTEPESKPYSGRGLRAEDESEAVQIVLGPGKVRDAVLYFLKSLMRGYEIMYLPTAAEKFRDDLPTYTVGPKRGTRGN
jgi:hypothetical protein